MKIKKQESKEVYIKTMPKETFNRLSKPKQRMAVAQDVLDRIHLKQIIPHTGYMCKVLSDGKEDSNDLKKKLDSVETKCEACAKGGLFLSYIGIKNNYRIGTKIDAGSHEPNGYYFGHTGNSAEMAELNKVFSREQLDMIEIAFEGQIYLWTISDTTTKDICKKFHNKYTNNKDRLKAICKNIIKNNGEFKP